MLYRKISLFNFGLSSYVRVLGFMLDELVNGNECIIKWVDCSNGLCNGKIELWVKYELSLG